MRPGCFDVHERVKDMSAGGVLACMCFPSFPAFSGRLFAGTDDKDLALAVVQAYNDWHIDEWAGAYPGRFIPMALPVLWDPELCADEIRRVAAKGCHSVTFTENPARSATRASTTSTGIRCGARWSRRAAILNIHLGSSGQLAVTAPDAPMDVMITLQPMNICTAAADLVWSRVFKKYPDLKVALSEGGTGWIPYFLDRLDRTYDMHHPWTGQDFGDASAVRRVPRAHPHVLHRRPDRAALRDDIGIDNICWEQDYPHSDSSWPTRRRSSRDGGAVRRPRRRAQQDHARERDALVPVRPVRAPPAGAVHGRRVARRVAGHDVSITRWTRAATPAPPRCARRARRRRP